jgi:hypothetical protein
VVAGVIRRKKDVETCTSCTPSGAGVSTYLADSDLVPAVEYVKAEGRQVELAFFDKCWELKNACDSFLEFDVSYFDDCI